MQLEGRPQGDLEQLAALGVLLPGHQQLERTEDARQRGAHAVGDGGRIDAVTPAAPQPRGRDRGRAVAGGRDVDRRAGAEAPPVDGPQLGDHLLEQLEEGEVDGSLVAAERGQHADDRVVAPHRHRERGADAEVAVASPGQPVVAAAEADQPDRCVGGVDPPGQGAEPHRHAPLDGGRQPGRGLGPEVPGADGRQRAGTVAEPARRRVGTHVATEQGDDLLGRALHVVGLVGGDGHAAEQAHRPVRRGRAGRRRRRVVVVR